MISFCRQAEHLETFLALLPDDPDTKGLPAYVEGEFFDYLQCGILAHGFLRLGCDACQKEILWLSVVSEGILSLVFGAAHGSDRGSPGRVCHAMGAVTHILGLFHTLIQDKSGV